MIDGTDVYALGFLSGEWRAGPSLPTWVVRCLPHFLVVGLVERQFLDMTPARVTIDAIGGAVQIGLSAAWHFRLTEHGKQILAAVEAKRPSPAINRPEGQGTP